jgi:hypothetical protein
VGVMRGSVGPADATDHVCYWPNADVETRFSIRPLSGVKRTCRVHVQFVCL